MRKLVQFCVDHPRLVVALTVGFTLLFAAQLPKIKTDTDPKNMLPITSPVRQYNNQVESWFMLHPDVIVLGIRNEEGIFHSGTLRRIETTTEAILKIPGVIARDVISLRTVDDVTSEGETLRAQPLLAEIPATPEQMAAFRTRLLANPLLVPRFHPRSKFRHEESLRHTGKRRATLRGDLLEFGVGEEPNPLSVGGKEGIDCALCAGKRSCLHLVEWPEIESPSGPSGRSNLKLMRLFASSLPSRDERESF